MVKLTRKERDYLEEEVKKRLFKLYPEEGETVTKRDSYIIETRNLDSQMRTEETELKYNNPHHLKRNIPSDLLVGTGRGKHTAYLKRPEKIFHFLPRPVESVDISFEDFKLLNCILKRKRKKIIKLLFRNSDFGKKLVNSKNFASLHVSLKGRKYLNFEYTYYIS